MCGIAGIITKRSEQPKNIIKKMISSLKHRGPDESGIYCFYNCTLGHTRLSIIDLKTGKQPMINKDETIGVVFNGEIYGFEEVKKKINYNFQTSSDTELLLALYDNFGRNMLDKLPGMFAFAIWDENKKNYNNKLEKSDTLIFLINK